ncbi:hypothetical protein [Streptomyces sp. NPDC094049]|uniref:hypothetical protein n=1 Tax=Streptomyces sp. NPDC094049 TaxID=3154987 RepID=UPI00332DA2F4
MLFWRAGSVVVRWCSGPGCAALRGVRADWPEQFCEGVTWPWQAIQYAGNGSVGSVTLTEDQAARAEVAGLIPAQSAQPEFWDDAQIDQ